MILLAKNGTKIDKVLQFKVSVAGSLKLGCLLSLPSRAAACLSV